MHEFYLNGGFHASDTLLSVLMEVSIAKMSLLYPGYIIHGTEFFRNFRIKLVTSFIHHSELGGLL